MLEKSAAELSFVTDKRPIPSIEIDLDSLPDGGEGGFGELATSALNLFAFGNEDARATVYTYFTLSVNFGEPTNSVLFGVAGVKAADVLKALHCMFERRKVRVRYSDYISADHKQYHIEDGKLWEPSDAMTWFSVSDDEIEDDDEGLIEIGELISACQESLDTDFDDENDGKSDSERSTRGVRIRAARGDATVGAIKQKIEQHFGLLIGSVRLCDPDGNSLRASAKISTLRQRWE